MKKSIYSSNMAKISPKLGGENSVGTILGLDFGEAKIGLAIADAETRMAFAFDTLANDHVFWTALREIVQCEGVQKIVVGVTRHAKDDASAQKKEAFIARLEKELDAPVFRQEEMFTTKMAQANLAARGAKNISHKDDAEAARIILQSWLEHDAD